ncbi:hypothetical protein [Micromonospora sp. WMMD1274]|uniref:hypothetical protein n=1 Tax=Micromonospora sp. WMMD1274 TaxID=3404116 RepID=UPI003B94FD09
MTTTDTQHTEDAAAYTRRTGRYPAHWTADRCSVQDARIRVWAEAAARGADLTGRSQARRMLRRWGVDA